MVPNKSLDEVNIIVALLNDAHTLHGSVFNTRALRNTRKLVQRRVRLEGISFLTKTLPKLAKAFDRAIAGDTPLNATSCRFAAMTGSTLPRFLGELFSCVLSTDGRILPDPNVDCVRIIRDILYLFYKYETPYEDEQVQSVLERFERTEEDLKNSSHLFANMQTGVDLAKHSRRRRITSDQTPTSEIIAREAKILLNKVFSFFDPYDIVPRHGPGAVATKQRPWDKFRWTNVSEKITSVYPLDAYFYASNGHICDSYTSKGLIGSETLDDRSLPARVVLVPKDSRGPRLISCEPVDYQWIQQGLSRAIVRLVESHPITKWNVNFTDQGPNRRGAFMGSLHGGYATLDLNEASDRVHLELVRLLFPPHVYTCLEACRSSSTVLPDGREIQLQKYAPMGSALCFPVLALTIWSLLTAGAPDEDTRESILVYGDDVIVPTAFAASAMNILESFGLKINRDKSCTSGLFRESCGMDAFKGYDVTPVRLRTVWSESPSPEVYESWIAYANSFFRRRYISTYETIVRGLSSVYGTIPTKDIPSECPKLPYVVENQAPVRRRWNPELQRFEYRVRVSVPKRIKKTLPGWLMLLRYFTEANERPDSVSRYAVQDPFNWIAEPFSVSSYTKRHASKLAWCWR